MLDEVADDRRCLSRTMERRAEALDALTAAFETKVGELAGTLSSAATEMEATAQSMSATAEQTDEQSMAVASPPRQIC